MKTKDQKYEEAMIRQAKTDMMTPKQRLKILDKRFGVGKGAVKERKKLLKQIKSKKPEEKNE